MTTKVEINPGVCGMVAHVTAERINNGKVQVTVETKCESVIGIIEGLGDVFDPYRVCFTRPGTGPIYGYAAEHYIKHGACPTIAGLVKAIEAEARLALPRDVYIRFQ